MAYGYLALGVLLPWFTGYIWLQTLARGERPPGALAARAGYGLFLGLAALQGLVHAWSATFGSVSYSGIMGLFFLAALGGTACAHYRMKQPAAIATPATPAGTPPPGVGSRVLAGLAILAAVLTLAHLALIATEVHYRPIYAWDGWQTWMYRAKAWFYQGALFPLAPPDQWLETGTITYNMPGYNYPTFSSVIAFWAALSLGAWSETLVNWPAFLAGVALLLALYGESRRAGFDRAHGLIAVYLLISLPLLGAHLSLPGQADIWMAGFTGLGYVALLRGLTTRDHKAVLLGLLLCALAAGVKNEGAVWFAGALAILVMTRWFAASLIAAAVVGGLFIAAAAADIGTWQIPFTSARVGIEQGTLHLPYLGSVPIVYFEVWDNYIEAFLLQDSWHLLWYLLLAALFSLALGARDRTWRALVAFTLVFGLSQLVIFGFTENGRWAEDGTAINRLPLQFAPALVYSLLLAWRRLAPGQTTSGAPARAMLVPGLIATLATAAVMVGWVTLKYPNSGGKPIDLLSRLFPAVGAADSGEQGLSVTRFEGGIAILSSGRAMIDASELNMLRLEITGDSRSSPGFFWRPEGQEDTVESVSIGTDGNYLIDLAESPAWRGTIIEAGLVLYDDHEGGTPGVGAMRLEPRTLTTQLENTWHDWTTPEYWGQASTNWIAGGEQDQAVPLNPVLFVWLFIALGCIAIIARRTGGTQAVLLAIVIAWLMSDARWLANSIRQAWHTADYYAGNGIDHLDSDIDANVREVTKATNQALGRRRTPILVTGHERALDFKSLRAKYWLLPHPAATFDGSLEEMPAIGEAKILYIDAFRVEPGSRKISPEELEIETENLHGGNWELEIQGGESKAFLLRRLQGHK